jgi:PIN like domain
MRILFDECVPRPLRRSLPGHDVRTVQEMGWDGLKNGDLLREFTNAGLDVFLTMDQNLQYQQNLRAAGVAIIVLIAVTNKLVDLAPLMPKVLVTLANIRPGELVEIGADSVGP